MEEILRKGFDACFGGAPSVIARAPGRLEVLGNHTDYNGGLVLSVAVDRDTWVALRAREDRMASIYDIRFKDRASFSLDNPEPFVSGEWVNYIKGVCLILESKGIALPGFDAVLVSSIPPSAGMSSSAAIEESFILGLRDLAGVGAGSAIENAKLGQEVENKVIGAQTGLMDQMTSLAGKKNQLLSSDFRDLKFGYVPFPSHLACVVANSNVKHDHTKDYNERREDCMRAVRELNMNGFDVSYLREVSLDELKATRTKMTPRAFLRAFHVVGENERVVAAKRALEVGDYGLFGDLLTISHKSSQSYFENSCPELDILVNLGSQLDGFVGARVSGGGFGGISLHIVEASKAQRYADRLNKLAEEKHGISPKAIVCMSADGASVVQSTSAK